MAENPPKANIKILDGSNANTEVDVRFNPTEYSIEYSNSFQETAPPGLSNPIIQFVNGNTQVLTMELLFDSYTDKREDVSKATNRFTQLVSIDGDLHAPPRVEFSWGVISFRAVVEKVSQRYTMFLADGTPVRATLTVTFKQYQSISEQLKNPPRNSADKTKRRVFERHDSVWLMAAREYGEARYWRLIAATNRIEDPTDIEPGTVLTLPPLEDFREVTPTS